MSSFHRVVEVLMHNAKQESMARTKDIIARQGILASIANECGELQLENSIYHFTLDTIPISRCKLCRLIL